MSTYELSSQQTEVLFEEAKEEINVSFDKGIEMALQGLATAELLKENKLAVDI